MSFLGEPLAVPLLDMVSTFSFFVFLSLISISIVLAVASVKTRAFLEKPTLKGIMLACAGLIILEFLATAEATKSLLLHGERLPTNFNYQVGAGYLTLGSGKKTITTLGYAFGYIQRYTNLVYFLLFVLLAYTLYYTLESLSQ